MSPDSRLTYSFFFLIGSNVCIFLYFFFFQNYSFIPLLFHIGTLLLLWLYVIGPRKFLPILKKRYGEVFIILLLVLIALGIRIYNIDVVTAGMWGDEISVAIAGDKTFALRNFLPYISEYVGHPTPLLYLVGLSIHFFGRTILAIRLQSIIFGALDVCIFYVLLRLFFKKTYAFIGALIFSFSYVHLVLSRFAYDMTATIFFEILTIIFLYKAYKAKNMRSYIGIALSIGAGLFTYYSFRTYAIAFFGIAIFLICKQEKSERIKKISIFIATLFVSTILLFSFDLHDMSHVLARTKAISVFNQGFPPSRVAGELMGNIKNDVGSLFFVGDPTPRQNPSATSFFDFITTCLYLTGLFLLFKKNKIFFTVSLLLILCALLNDVFTVEIFPEFHFYGTGHPNILRLSGIIPIIYFWCMYAIVAIGEMGRKMYAAFYKPILLLFVLIIIALNWAFYFSQPPSPYNYKYNGEKMIKITKFMNDSSIKSFFVSPAIFHDERAAYFLSSEKHMYPFQMTTASQAIEALGKNTITIIDPEENTPLVQEIITQVGKGKSPLKQEIVTNDFGGSDFVIFTK